MEQPSWSRTNKTSGAIAKQKSNTPEVGQREEFECKILMVRNQSKKIECLIEPINRKALSIKNVWFPLMITESDFAKSYGGVEAFNERPDKPVASFSYRSPNYSTGKIYIKTSEEIDLERATKSKNENLGEIILGFSKASESGRIVEKPSPNSNTAIVKENNKIQMNTDKSFMAIAENGISIGGPINFQSLPSDHSYGMMLKMQNPLLGLIPSTAVTPIPLYRLNLPTKAIGEAIALFSVAAKFLA